MNIQEWRNYLMETELSWKAKYVGLTLSLYYGKSKEVYPSIRTLSDLTSLSVNPVQDAIKELCEKKLIQKKMIRRGGITYPYTSYLFPLVSSGDTPSDTPSDTSSDTSSDISPRDTKLEKLVKVENKKKNQKIFLESFWAAYPKQRAGSQEKAFVAWSKATDDGRGTIEEIKDGVLRYSKSDEVVNGYAKGAAAWLNDDRWKNTYGISKKEAKPWSPF